MELLSSKLVRAIVAEDEDEEAIVNRFREAGKAALGIDAMLSGRAELFEIVGLRTTS